MWVVLKVEDEHDIEVNIEGDEAKDVASVEVNNDGNKIEDITNEGDKGEDEGENEAEDGLDEVQNEANEVRCYRKVRMRLKMMMRVNLNNLRRLVPHASINLPP